MDNETIAIVGALIINAIATGWSIRETSVLHKQTKELQESNAKLQSEVNRLSVHMNQEIIRLNRINELTRGMYLSVSRRNHKLQLIVSEPRKDAMAKLSSDDFMNEVTDTVITLHGSIIEMKAIANVIGDSELQSLIEKLRTSVPIFNLEESEKARQKRHHEFGTRTTAVLEKVYTLLQEATASA